nr:YdcF family protein [Clostridium cibarium]
MSKSYTIVAISIGTILILYHFLKEHFKKIKYFKKFHNYCSTIFCIGLLLFILLEAFIIGCPKLDKSKSEFLLVLGEELKNGENMSLILRDRLDKAVNSIYREGDGGYIILSGGRRRADYISEADAMERYLLDQGIPKERIIKENKSMNINENFKFSKDIIEKQSGKAIKDISVKIITTDYLVLRCGIIASRNGYGNVKFNASGTRIYLAPIYYIIEVFEVISTIF